MRKEIGLTKSHFVNSTGLPAEGHVMTARELAMLAHYLIKTYPEYYHYFGEKEFNFGKCDVHQSQSARLRGASASTA